MSACLEGTVTRSLLALPSLHIGGASDVLQFNGANDASTAAAWTGDRWERQMADSPWVHGEHQVMARRRNSDIQMSLWVMDSSPAAIQTAYEALRDAVSQWTWQLTLMFDTASYVFTCWPSDIRIGFTQSHGLSLMAPVSVSVPVMPTY